jgi:hypothetical protein
MSSKGRWTLALGSFLTVSALGSWGCCSVRCCDTKPRDQLVVVSTTPSNEDVVPNPEVVISKSKNHQIVWLLPAGSPIRHIDLKLRPNQPPSPGPKWPPFAACGENPNVCRIACADMLCRSGPIHPTLEPGKKGTYYDYWFIREGGEASADPGIRIDP